MLWEETVCRCLRKVSIDRCRRFTKQLRALLNKNKFYFCVECSTQKDLAKDVCRKKLGIKFGLIHPPFLVCLSKFKIENIVSEWAQKFLILFLRVTFFIFVSTKNFCKILNLVQ